MPASKRIPNEPLEAMRPGGQHRCQFVRQDGTQCGGIARSGTDRCKRHSRALAGPLHPSFVHGRHSKVLPVRLLERYQASLSDPDLLSHRDDIALVDARMQELLSRVETGESENLWARLQKAYGEMTAARRAGDTARLADALTRMGELIQGGVNEAAAWHEVYETLEYRRKLAESEHKRLVSLHQVLTAEEAITLLAVVADTIRRHVTDRAALLAISRDLAALYGQMGAGSPEGILEGEVVVEES